MPAPRKTRVRCKSRYKLRRLANTKLFYGWVILFGVLLSACSGGSNDTPASPVGMGNSGHSSSGFVVIGEQESVSGQLMVDAQNAPFIINNNIIVSGSYGDLTVNTSGFWLYVLNDNADLITKGSTAEEILEIYEDSLLVQTITILINSVNVKERSVVFIAVNFNDDLVTDEINEFELDDIFFNDSDSVNELYKANSLGQIKFIRDNNNDSLLDYYTSYINFNVSDGTCDGIPEGQDWADAADAYIETTFNVSPNDWDHRVYLFPRATAPSCDYAGLAPISCSPKFCWAFINAHIKSIIAHELGHNFGFGHAGTDKNNDGDTDDANEGEYNDGGAIMGSFSGSRTIEAAHRDLVDWYAGYPDYVAELNSAGSITIQTIQHTANELPNNGLPQLLRVFNPNPGLNMAAHYYVSYYESHPNSNSFPFHDRKVKVHYLSAAVDTEGASHRVALLRTGESFTDSFTGLTIKVDAIISGAATISVAYD